MPFPVLWFSYQNLNDHLGWSPWLMPRWTYRLSCWRCWKAGQQLRFIRHCSQQSHQSALVWCAKTCEWDWRRIYCPPTLDGPRWNTVLQSMACLQHPCCFSYITAQNASVCNVFREIQPFDDSKHDLMDTPKEVLMTFVSLYIFWFVSFSENLGWDNP